MISMAQHKTAVTPLLMHWIYHSLCQAIDMMLTILNSGYGDSTSYQGTFKYVENFHGFASAKDWKLLNIASSN